MGYPERYTSIPTPETSSPSTPLGRGLKRKFEEEPTHFELPSPLLGHFRLPEAQTQTPPSSTSTPENQMSFLTNFQFNFEPIQYIVGKFAQLFRGLNTYETPVTESQPTSESIPEVIPAPTDFVPPTVDRPPTPNALEVIVPRPTIVNNAKRKDDAQLQREANEKLAQVLKRRDAQRPYWGRTGGRGDLRKHQRLSHNRLAGSPLSVYRSSLPSRVPPPPRASERARRRHKLKPDPKVEEAKMAHIPSAESLAAYIAALVERKEDGFQNYEQVQKERAKREAEIQRLKELSLKPKEPIVKPLSAVTLAEVHKVLVERNQSRPIIDKFRVTIHIRDIQTLRESQWLNDEIINFYLSLICERANAGSKKVKVYAFNSFFYKKLSESGYKSVERWSKKGKIDGENLLRLDYLIVPVHLHNHWTLGVLNVQRKRIEYYDSLGGQGTAFYKHMRVYLRGELKDKVNLDEWEDYSMEGAPMQTNGWDSEVVSRGVEPLFTQGDIMHLRKRMVAEIMRGELGVE
ncbi:hypothetical protein BDZ91DRAFT_737351 [Kalaharituber pfeilii]|nr:hypothetical protein BDZ91DRAFT_737351 [Kalaharituber pfeilii]